MKRRYVCSICGGRGHNARTCGKVDHTRDQITGRLTVEEKERRRQKRLVATQKRIRARYPGMVPMLGRCPDAKLGAIFGLSRQRIQQFRVLFDVVHAEPVPRVQLPSGWEEALGTASDPVLAHRWGVSVSTVSTRRRERGIASSRSFVSWGDVIPLLGTMSDGKVARKFGISTNAVFLKRRELGVAPFRKSPKSPGFVPVDREKVQELFDQGFTDDDIASEVGVLTSTLKTIRWEMGLTRHPRKRCSVCGGVGHNRRKCPNQQQ